METQTSKRNFCHPKEDYQTNKKLLYELWSGTGPKPEIFKIVEHKICIILIISPNNEHTIPTNYTCTTRVMQTKKIHKQTHIYLISLAFDQSNQDLFKKAQPGNKVSSSFLFFFFFAFGSVGRLLGLEGRPRPIILA